MYYFRQTILEVKAQGFRPENIHHAHLYICIISDKPY
jgi:hypothetical protein